MRVIGYTRVSTSEQATGGVSLDAQADRVRAYCGLYGLEMVELIPDAGGSGKSLQRPGLARALELMASGTADGLVVAKLDRLTRSVSDLGTLLARHFGESAGRHLFSVADSIDTRSAAGRLVLHVLTSVAQWEREVIVERTTEALRHKASRGERTGSVPYGWDLDRSGPYNRHGRPVKLVSNPAEQAILAGIRTSAHAGLGARAIAGQLNAAQVPTKTGRVGWTHSTVRKILARLERQSS